MYTTLTTHFSWIVDYTRGGATYQLKGWVPVNVSHKKVILYIY